MMEDSKLMALKVEEMDDVAAAYGRASWYKTRLNARGLMIVLTARGLWKGGNKVMAFISRAHQGGPCNHSLDGWSVDDAKWFSVGCRWVNWYNATMDYREAEGVGASDLETTDVQGYVRDGDYGGE